MKRNYHSLLFVPANSDMLSKIENINADAVIIDLEDSIRGKDKDKALVEAELFLNHYSFDKDIFVRINPDRSEQEINVLNKFCITGYMLPKAENNKDIIEFCKLSSEKKLIALIETLGGVIGIREIAANSCVNMIAFGAEDYTAQTGIRNEDEFLSYVKSKIVLYAKAYGKKVFDTVSINITDKEKYCREAQKSRDYGFDGKLTIHPMQVEVVNNVYKGDDIDYYRYILDEYDKNDRAILKLDGRIYEKPHIERIRKIIQEWEG